MAENRDPSKIAEARDLARKLGSPMLPQLNALHDARVQAASREVADPTFEQRFPMLALRLQNPDVDWTTMARDDLGNLTQTESTFGWLSRSFDGSTLETLRGGLRQLGVPVANETRATKRARMENAQIKAERDTGLAWFMQSVIDVGASMSATVAAGAVGGLVAGPAGAATAAGTVGYLLNSGEVYNTMIDEGFTPAEASRYSRVFGAFMGALDTVSAGLTTSAFSKTLGKKLVPMLVSKKLTGEAKKDLLMAGLREHLVGYGTEVATEVMQQGLSLTARYLAHQNYREGEDWNVDVGGELWDTFVHTAAGMSLISGGGAAFRARRDIQRAANAKQTVKGHQQTQALEMESKLRNLDPKAREGFVTEVAGNSDTAFIRADKLLDEVAAAEKEDPEIRAKIEKSHPGMLQDAAIAAEHGGNVEMPTGQWQSLALTDFGKLLMQHTTYHQDGDTDFERAEITQLGRDFSPLMAEAAEKAATDEEFRTTYNTIYDQFYEAAVQGPKVTPEQAAANASVSRALVASLAATEGVDLADFWAENGPQILVGAPEGTAPQLSDKQIERRDKQFADSRRKLVEGRASDITAKADAIASYRQRAREWGEPDDPELIEATTKAEEELSAAGITIEDPTGVSAVVQEDADPDLLENLGLHPDLYDVTAWVGDDAKGTTATVKTFKPLLRQNGKVLRRGKVEVHITQPGEALPFQNRKVQDLKAETITTVYRQDAEESAPNTSEDAEGAEKAAEEPTEDAEAAEETVQKPQEGQDPPLVTPKAPPPKPKDPHEALSYSGEVGELVRGEKFRTRRDFKVAIDEMESSKVVKGLEGQARADHIAKVAFRDAKFALDHSPNAVGWYDNRVQAALKTLGALHPELMTDWKARMKFVWALAVTSNGLKVDKNFELAEAVYQRSKKNGLFPTDVGIGNAANAINDGLRSYNKLMKAWGAHKLFLFMTTPATVEQLTTLMEESGLGIKVDSSESPSETVYGAHILGSKIGNGFYMNLHGELNQLTMDRWFIRTWGRWTGTLFSFPSEKSIDENFSKMRGALVKITKKPKLLAEVNEVYGFDIRSVSMEVLARRTQKLAQSKETRDTFFAKNENLEALRKAGNNVWKGLDGQKEAPSGPAERSEIRSFMRPLLAQLQAMPGYADLTMADLQAALWYAEKRYYEQATKETGDLDGYDDDDAPDYGNAARDLALANGVSQEKIDEALAGPDLDLLAGEGLPKALNDTTRRLVFLNATTRRLARLQKDNPAWGYKYQDFFADEFTSALDGHAVSWLKPGHLYQNALHRLIDEAGDYTAFEMPIRMGAAQIHKNVPFRQVNDHEGERTFFMFDTPEAAAAESPTPAAHFSVEFDGELTNYGSDTPDQTIDHQAMLLAQRAGARWIRTGDKNLITAVLAAGGVPVARMHRGAGTGNHLTPPNSAAAANAAWGPVVAFVFADRGMSPYYNGAELLADVDKLPWAVDATALRAMARNSLGQTTPSTAPRKDLVASHVMRSEVVDQILSKGLNLTSPSMGVTRMAHGHAWPGGVRLVFKAKSIEDSEFIYDSDVYTTRFHVPIKQVHDLTPAKFREVIDGLVKERGYGSLQELLDDAAARLGPDATSRWLLARDVYEAITDYPSVMSMVNALSRGGVGALLAGYPMFQAPLAATPGGRHVMAAVTKGPVWEAQGKLKEAVTAYLHSPGPGSATEGIAEVKASVIKMIRERPQVVVDWAENLSQAIATADFTGIEADTVTSVEKANTELDSILAALRNVGEKTLTEKEATDTYDSLAHTWRYLSVAVAETASTEGSHRLRFAMLKLFEPHIATRDVVAHPTKGDLDVTDENILDTYRAGLPDKDDARGGEVPGSNEEALLRTIIGRQLPASVLNKVGQSLRAPLANRRSQSTSQEETKRLFHTVAGNQVWQRNSTYGPDLFTFVMANISHEIDAEFGILNDQPVTRTMVVNAARRIAKSGTVRLPADHSLLRTRVREDAHEVAEPIFQSFAEIADRDGANTLGVPVGFVDEFALLLTSLRNAVEEYYEVKPVKTVNWDDVAFATVTKNQENDATAEALKKRGVRVVRVGDRGRDLHEVLMDLPKTVRKDVLFQEGDEAPRGGYNRDLNTIFLTPDMDASTLVHEMAHYYLDELGRIAQQQGQQSSSYKRLKQITEWMGMPSVEHWLALDQEQRRQGHEAFALTFEKFLHSGAGELKDQFRSFRKWLTAIYVDVEQRLNEHYKKHSNGEDLPALTDDVRQLFGTMVATEAEVNSSSEIAELEVLFQTEEEFVADGGTAEDYQKLRAMHKEAEAQAEDELIAARLRAVAQINNASDEVRRKLAREHRDARQEVKKEVEPQVRNTQVERARRWLRNGDHFDENGELLSAVGHVSVHKVNEAEAASLVDSRTLNKLRRMGALTEEGVPADTLADLFGYATGAEALEDVAMAPTREAATERAVRAEMARRHPNLTDPKLIKEQIAEAVHNKARETLVAAEHNHLAKDPRPVRTLVKAARQAALKKLAGTPIHKIRPSTYAIAARKARTAAQAALKKGDRTAALAAKRQEMMAEALLRAAADIRAQVRKFEKLMAVARRGDKKLRATRDMNMVAIMRGVLAMVDAGRKGENPDDALANVREYAPESMEPVAHAVNALSESLRANGMLDRSALDANPKLKRTPRWQVMRLEDFENLHALVEMIDGFSKSINRVQLADKKMSRDAAVETIVEEIEVARPKDKDIQGRSASAWDKMVEKTRRYFNAITRVGHMFQSIGPTLGAMHDRMKRAAVAYRRLAADLTQSMADDIALLDLTSAPKRIVATQLGGFEFGRAGEPAKAEILRMLLHFYSHGSEKPGVSNRDKLLASEGWTADGVEKFVQELVDDEVLTEQDFDFMRRVYARNASLVPQVQRSHYARLGYYMDLLKVENQDSPFGPIGGYVPATPDRERVGRMLKFEQDDIGRMHGTMPMKSDGFTKARSEHAVMKLDFRLGNLTRHFSETAKFIHMQAAHAEVASVLRDRRVQQAFERKFGTSFNTDVVDTWLQTATNQAVPPPSNQIIRLVGYLSRSLKTAVMVANVPVAIANLTGLPTVMREVGFSRAMKALAHVTPDGVRAIMERSPAMRERLGHQLLDVERNLNDLIIGNSPLAKLKRGARFVDKHKFILHTATQLPVDVVAYIAGYAKAKDSGMTDAQAEDYAVSLVERTQMATNPEDISKASSDQLMNAVFPFRSWAENFANRVWFAMNEDVRGDKSVPRKVADLLTTYVYAVIGPTVVASAIMDGMRAGEDDEEDMLSAYYILKSHVDTAAGGFPVVGDAARLIGAQFDDKVWNNRMNNMPFQAVIERVAAATTVFSNEDATAKDYADVAGIIATLLGAGVVDPILKRLGVLITDEGSLLLGR